MKYVFPIGCTIVVVASLILMTSNGKAAAKTTINTRVTCQELAQIKPWMTRDEVDQAFGKRVSNLDDFQT